MKQRNKAILFDASHEMRVSHRCQSAEKDNLVTIGTVKHFNQCLDDLTMFKGDLQVLDDAIIVSHDEAADDEGQRQSNARVQYDENDAIEQTVEEATRNVQQDVA